MIVSRGADDELSPAELSGFARVQQAVGKRAVIATVPLPTEGTTTLQAEEEEEEEAAVAAEGGVTRGAGGASAVGGGSTGTVLRSGGSEPAGVDAGKEVPHRGQGETATSTITVTSSALPSAARAVAGAGEGSNEGVRYVTLQFHAVSSRT